MKKLFVDIKAFIFMTLFFAVAIYFIASQFFTNKKFKENGIRTKGVVVAYDYDFSPDEDGESLTLKPVIDYYPTVKDTFHFTAYFAGPKIGDTVDVVYLKDNPLRVKQLTNMTNNLGYLTGGIIGCVGFLFLIIILTWKKKNKDNPIRIKD